MIPMIPSRIGPSVLALLLLPVGVAAQGAAGGGADPAVRVDSIFAAWSARTAPGCAVGVSQQGRPVLARGYGMADLEQGTANTGSTIFEAGSVAKQFTVAAVVLLAQEGKLSLDDDVRRHVPELPEYEAPLTLRHLIHHTSGLRDWGTVVAAAGWPRTSRVHTQAHALDVLSRQRSLNYVPGAEYSYTNSGFNLLAIIAERASGEPFAEFSRRRIFEPLGMRDTQWRDDFTRIVPGRATAYGPGPDGSFRILMPFENVHGNGGLLTTVGDLLTWNRNLESGTVGGPELVREMHRQGRLNDGREIAYAGGLRVSSYKGVREVGHSGSTAGYRAFLTRFPDQDVSVAVLCNAANANAGALAHRTAEVFLGDAVRPEPAPRPARVAPSALEARAGLYRNLRTSEPLRLALRDGRLRVDGRAELVPLSPTLFQVGSGEDRLDFTPGGSYRSGSMRLLTDDGEVIEFERVAEAAPTPDQLRELQGEYHSDEAEVTYTVAVVDGSLQLRRRPDTAIPLAPAYADAFTTPSGWLVRFTRGADGRVEAMSFGMGRVRDLRFARLAP
jgi:CubicO group peptidase (beta-lactamase class C family)